MCIFLLEVTQTCTRVSFMEWRTTTKLEDILSTKKKLQASTHFRTHFLIFMVNFDLLYALKGNSVLHF